MSVVEPEFLARLRAFVRRRVPSAADADDVLQTIHLRLLESRDRPAPESTHAWLLATARRAIADLHRARARSHARTEPAIDVAEQDGDDASDVTRCLAPLLARLAADDAELLTRVDVVGESQTAIARERSLSVSGLKSRVQRARERLRDAVLAHCAVERDATGFPAGPARCKPGPNGDACGCE